MLAQDKAMSKMLFFFFFNNTATTEIYTLSLHDALPISWWRTNLHPEDEARVLETIDNILETSGTFWKDRKSTRLNSSHGYISYAVFCLKKKKNEREQNQHASCDA